MSDKQRCAWCGSEAHTSLECKSGDGQSSLAESIGSADLAAKLKSPELAEETITELEALAFRAVRAGEKEVEDAVRVVLCALQGYWKNPPNGRANPTGDDE